MPETTGAIVSLNWPALVTEAVRRRKEERLTQKAHAALAGVSIPTMIAFDRAERTLSLAKAIAILRVVGLVEETPPEGSRDLFVRNAFERWRHLTMNLKKDSPERFGHGWYRIDYTIEGEIKGIDLHRFPSLLQRAVVPHSGWPMFRLPTRMELTPPEVDGVIECWLAPDGKPGLDHLFHDTGHCDFWRGSPSGRMFLIRGYQEDAQETFSPGTIFDTTLPIRRIGEAFLHAAKLTRLMARRPESASVQLRVLYTGLQGRDLRAWASPMDGGYFNGGRSRSDEVLLEGCTAAGAIDENLGAQVYPLIASLFERFGVTGISAEFVESVLARMRANRFDHDATGTKA